MKLRFPILAVALVSGLGFLAIPWMNAEPVRYNPPPESVRFKPGPEVVRAISHCSSCHSADYVSTQPTLPRATWKAIVIKMQKVHGAPIPDSEVDPIVEYLVKTYGAEKATAQK